MQQTTFMLTCRASDYSWTHMQLNRQLRDGLISFVFNDFRQHQLTTIWIHEDAWKTAYTMEPWIHTEW